MTITREQVADLQPGDVVELTFEDWPDGTVVRGPLYVSAADPHALYVGSHCVRFFDGSTLAHKHAGITVISRAPRPLYVNRPRTSTWPGDVVRSADTVNNNQWTNQWMCLTRDLWIDLDGAVMRRKDLPKQLVLLVDGETGTVVQ